MNDIINIIKNKDLRTFHIKDKDLSNSFFNYLDTDIAIVDSNFNMNNKILDLLFQNLLEKNKLYSFSKDIFDRYNISGELIDQYFDNLNILSDEYLITQKITYKVHEFLFNKLNCIDQNYLKNKLELNINYYKFNINKFKDYLILNFRFNLENFINNSYLIGFTVIDILTENGECYIDSRKGQIIRHLGYYDEDLFGKVISNNSIITKEGFRIYPTRNILSINSSEIITTVIKCKVYYKDIILNIKRKYITARRLTLIKEVWKKKNSKRYKINYI